MRNGQSRPEVARCSEFAVISELYGTTPSTARFGELEILNYCKVV